MGNDREEVVKLRERLSWLEGKFFDLDKQMLALSEQFGPSSYDLDPPTLDEIPFDEFLRGYRLHSVD